MATTEEGADIYSVIETAHIDELHKILEFLVNRSGARPDRIRDLENRAHFLLSESFKYDA